MAENNDDIFTRLKNGEKVICSICHKGFYIPYNATPDKAHSFVCSNKNCNGHYHWDPNIDIE